MQEKWQLSNSQQLKYLVMMGLDNEGDCNQDKKLVLNYLG